MDLFQQLLVMSQSAIVIGLVVSIAFGALCGLIAARRKARWVYWSVMGFAFGPLALPFVFLAKPKAPTGGET